MIVYRALKQVEFWSALILLVAVLGLTGWASVTRFLGVPNIWVLEITQVCFAWVCFLAAVLAFRESQHFSVEFLTALLPDKISPWLGPLRSAIMLVLLVALGWIALDFVEVAGRRRLPLTGIRNSWVAAALPTACLLMALHCVEALIIEIRALRRGTDPRDEGL